MQRLRVECTLIIFAQGTHLHAVDVLLVHLAFQLSCAVVLARLPLALPEILDLPQAVGQAVSSFGLLHLQARLCDNVRVLQHH